MRYQVPALAGHDEDQGIFGACPKGLVPASSAVPTAPAYQSYAAPVVLAYQRTKSLEGGIFRSNGLSGLGAAQVTQSQLEAWFAQAKTGAEAVARQMWAAANPGQPPPPGGVPSATPEEKILGLPAPVALGGAAIIALLLIKKR